MSHPMNDRHAERQAVINANAHKSRNPLPWIAAALVLLLLAGGIGFGLWKNSQHKDDVAEALQNVTAPPHANAAKSGIVVNPGKASASAPLVTLYQDYQCPGCKLLEANFGGALEELANQGKIRLEYHTMTFLDQNLRNTASTAAAEAAACSDVVGHYAAYHDEIYKNQPQQEGAGYTKDQLVGPFAQAAGITGKDLDVFKGCVDRRTMQNWVVGTNEAATNDKIQSTPTLRVNGKDFVTKGITSPDDFKTKLLAAAK